jgi:hypothetical protein
VELLELLEPPPEVLLVHGKLLPIILLHLLNTLLVAVALEISLVPGL